MSSTGKSEEVKAPEVKFFENSEYLLRLFKKTINDAVKKGYKGFLHAGLINLAEKSFQSYEKDFTIESFIKRSFKHWDNIYVDITEKDPEKLKKITDEQDDFIYKNATVLFSGVNEKLIDINKVVHEIYKVKFNKNDTIITPSCRLSVMKTLKSFVKYSIEYLNMKPLAKEKILAGLESGDRDIFIEKIEEYKKKLSTTEEITKD